MREATTAYYRKSGPWHRLSVQQDSEELVRSKFKVKEFFALPEGELEFQVEYDGGTKRSFELLLSGLEPKGYRPELSGSKDECVLTLRKTESGQGTTSSLTRVIALFAVASVVVFAIAEVLNNQLLAPSVSGYFVFFSFSVGTAILMAAHEAGQRLAARKRKSGHAYSYLIPWLPFLPPAPSLGFTTSQRTPALNRDHLFDSIIAGPLLMLAFALVIYALGDLTSAQSPLLYQWAHNANASRLTNPSAMEMSVDALLGPVLPKAVAGALPISPLADAATVGLILVFIGLLPMATFDGGYLSLAAWGERAARALTYVCAFGLLLLDTPTYWALAVFVLLLAGRRYSLKLLDSVSELSTSRQWIFIGTLVLAFLCLPLPHNLGTLSLG